MSERVFKKPEGALPSIKFIKASKLAEEDFKGVVLEGEFVEPVTNDFNPEKDDYKFKLEDGSIAIVNSTSSLAQQMRNVKVGDFVQISYLGKKKMTKGNMKGKEKHQFEVLVA